MIFLVFLHLCKIAWLILEGSIIDISIPINFKIDFKVLFLPPIFTDTKETTYQSLPKWNGSIVVTYL